MMQTVNFKLTDAQYRKLIKAREKEKVVFSGLIKVKNILAELA